MMLFVMTFFPYENEEHNIGTPEEIFQYMALGKTEAIQNIYCISNLCARFYGMVF